MKDKRITRLLKLFQMLQSGQGQNSAGLAQACGVGRRTIFRDLEALRKTRVPLEYNADSGRYWIPADARISSSDFTRDEAFFVSKLGDKYKRQLGKLPFDLAVQSSAEKLERRLSARTRKGLRRRTLAIQIRDHAISRLGSKAAFFQRLLDAIDARQLVRIEY